MSGISRKFTSQVRIRTRQGTGDPIEPIVRSMAEAISALEERLDALETTVKNLDD